MLIALLPLLALAPLLKALPQPDNGVLSVPVSFGSGHAKRWSTDSEERRAWFQSRLDAVKAKYGVKDSSVSTKRATEAGASQGETLRAYQYDTYYFIHTSVGTPAQTFELEIDTGSADTWVGMMPCDSGSSCNDQPQFNPNKSSTYRTSGQPYKAVYGSGGEIDGVKSSDTVSVGRFTQADQPIAVITAGENLIVTPPGSGILGLAWDTLSQGLGTPFWLNLVKQGKLSQNLFGLYLGRHQQGPDMSPDAKNGGELRFGGVNPDHYTGSINYVDLVSKDVWRVTLQGVSNYYSKTGGVPANEAAIDSGTNYIIGPPADVARFWKTVPGAAPLGGGSFYDFPCNQTLGLNLIFGGIPYAINEYDSNLGELTVGSGRCIGSIIALDLGLGVPWVIGSDALKSIYTVFRYDPPAVGFAQSK